MLLRLLSLFSVVQRLLSDLGKAQNEALIMQDRLAFFENDRQRLWEEMQKARTAETESLRMLCNIEYQRHHGIVPFPDSVHLPPAPTSGGPPSIKMTASQAIDAQIDKVVRDLQTRMAKQ